MTRVTIVRLYVRRATVLSMLCGSMCWSDDLHWISSGANLYRSCLSQTQVLPSPSLLTTPFTCSCQEPRHYKETDLIVSICFYVPNFDNTVYAADCMQYQNPLTIGKTFCSDALHLLDILYSNKSFFHLFRQNKTVLNHLYKWISNSEEKQGRWIHGSQHRRWVNVWLHNNKVEYSPANISTFLAIFTKLNRTRETPTVDKEVFSSILFLVLMTRCSIPPSSILLCCYHPWNHIYGNGHIAAKAGLPHEGVLGVLGDS